MEAGQYNPESGQNVSEAAMSEARRSFCKSWYKLSGLYECRGTSLIGAVNLSPVTKLVAGTGAVSRYKLSRSQKFVKVQDLNCGQMGMSGCNNHYKAVLGAGAKAKSVTNNLTLLSVLAQVVCPESLRGTKLFFEVVT
jgi:hypothetical protein